MAYAGMVNHEGRLLHAYYLVGPDANPQGEAHLFPEPVGSFEIGVVFSVETKSGGAQIVTKTALGTGTHVADQEVLAEWEARHGAIAASEAAWEAKMPQGAFAGLDPIREAYRRLDEERRGVLLAQVVRYLCDPQ